MKAAAKKTTALILLLIFPPRGLICFLISRTCRQDVSGAATSGSRGLPPPLRHRKAHRGEGQKRLAVPDPPLKFPGPRIYISIGVERIGVPSVLFACSGSAVWPHLDP